jgi:Cu(I)/Ag(I) efflux system membrane fusion protein
MKKVFLLISVVALMATGSTSVYAQHSGSHDHKQEATPVDTTKAKSNLSDTHAEFTVQGSCGMCKSRIEKTAKGVAGVSSAAWDSKTKKLHLHYDAKKTSVEAISKAIAKVGHDTDKDKADDETYNALPGCCKYRK